MKEFQAPILKPITVGDIAREAKVALATVSAALHDTGRVGPQQRQRIREIALRMGYQPKLAARMLRARRTNRLGLVFTGEANPSGVVESGFSGPVLAAFLDCCERLKLGYHVEFLANRLDDTDFTGPEFFVGRMVDAALTVGYLGDGPAAGWFDINQARFPSVSIGEPAEFAALSNDQLGIHSAVEYLASIGHRKVGYVGTSSPYWNHGQGILGFERAVKDFDLDINGGQWIKIRPSMSNRQKDIGEGVALSHSLLDGSERPTAVVCQSVPAARCLQYVGAELRIRVPEDLSLIAYGTSSDAEKSPPLLTSIEPAYNQMVSSAIDLLLRRMDATQAFTAKLTQAVPNLVHRRSVAPPSN